MDVHGGGGGGGGFGQRPGLAKSMTNEWQKANVAYQHTRLDCMSRSSRERHHSCPLACWRLLGAPWAPQPHSHSPPARSGCCRRRLALLPCTTLSPALPHSTNMMNRKQQVCDGSHHVCTAARPFVSCQGLPRCLCRYSFVCSVPHQVMHACMHERQQALPV